MGTDGGTRRTLGRARRRAVRRLRLCLAVVGGCSLVACGTQVAPDVDPLPSEAIPYAELVASGPDCRADEIVEGMTGMPQDTSRLAPAAGSVPPRFGPVDVVLCRVLVTMSEESSPAIAVPRRDDLDEPNPDVPHSGGADVIQRLTIEEVTLDGDLDPLLAALDRTSAPRSSGPCMAKMEMHPQIFLVDAMGRAVRPQWPVDGCGFLHAGAADTLGLLTETDLAEREVEQCVGRCATDGHD